VLARGIVLFSLLFERSDFDGDTAVVDTQGYGGVDLAFTVVGRFAGILSLSRLAFAESNRADGTSVDRGIQFVFIVFAANEGDLRSITAVLQFDTAKEFAILAILISIRNFAAFFQGETLAFATSRTGATGIGVYGARAVQIRTESSQRNLLERTDLRRLGTGRRLATAATAAAGAVRRLAGI